MFRNLTFNSIIWILMGLICFGAGAYFGWEYRQSHYQNVSFARRSGFYRIGNDFMRFYQWFYRSNSAWEKIQKVGSNAFYRWTSALNLRLLEIYLIHNART